MTAVASETLFTWAASPLKFGLGYGQSAFIGVGGDPILGTTITDAVLELDSHPSTDAIVLVGEIGGTMEEEAADYIAMMDKPLVAFIAGRSSPPDRRMGYAEAIVTGGKGSGSSEVRSLLNAGATVIDVPGQISSALSTHDIQPMVGIPAGSAASRPMSQM